MKVPMMSDPKAVLRYGLDSDLNCKVCMGSEWRCGFRQDGTVGIEWPLRSDSSLNYSLTYLTAELGLPCCAAWAFCSCEVGFSLWWLLLLWSCLNFTCYVPFSKLRGFLSGLRCPPAGDLPNPGTKNPGLLHCRWILYQLSHRGSPRIREWVASPVSCRPSQPRNQIGVSGIAGRFFTN